MHFLNLSQNFTKFLTFLLRNCSLNSKSTRTRRKNSNLVKNNRRKKPIFFFEKSNYLTKKSTNWTLRLLSWPIRANSVFYSITFPPSLFLFSSCFASAGCLRVPHMGRLNNRRVRFSIFYSIAFPPSLLLFSSCFASAGCLRVPHMGRLNNRGVRFSIFYSIAFPPSLLLFSSC